MRIEDGEDDEFGDEDTVISPLALPLALPPSTGVQANPTRPLTPRLPLPPALEFRPKTGSTPPPPTSLRPHYPSVHWQPGDKEQGKPWTNDLMLRERAPELALPPRQLAPRRRPSTSTLLSLGVIAFLMAMLAMTNDESPTPLTQVDTQIVMMPVFIPMEMPAPTVDLLPKEQSRLLYRRGMVQLSENELVAAEHSLQVARRVDSANDDPLRALGQVHQRMGHYALAIQWYRRYLRRAPQAADAAAIRLRIDNISR